MALKPGSLNESYEAGYIWGNGRSAILDDLAEQDLEFFESILDEMTDCRLKSRIAVNEYSKIPLEPKSLNQFKIDAFERDIRPSRLSKITKNQYAEISNKF
nr:hypothetical protein [Campylobacter showae]